MGVALQLGSGRYRFRVVMGPGMYLRVPLIGEVFVGGGQGFTVDRWRDCRDA